MPTKPAFIQNYCKNSNTVKYYCNLDILYIYYIFLHSLYFFKCNLFFEGKAEFSAAINPVLSVTWSLRNNYNILICCLFKKHKICLKYNNAKSLLSIFFNLIVPCWIIILIKNNNKSDCTQTQNNTSRNMKKWGEVNLVNIFLNEIICKIRWCLFDTCL